MIVCGKIYLDTNIFILAFENNDGVSAALARLIAKGGTAQFFTTSELTLSELLVRPYRDGNLSAIRSYERLIQSSPWLQVLPVARPVLMYAAALRSRYKLKLPDAIHVSTALGAGCRQMLTADLGIQGTYQIPPIGNDEQVEPWPLTILRPDEFTLASLTESLSA